MVVARRLGGWSADAASKRYSSACWTPRGTVRCRPRGARRPGGGKTALLEYAVEAGHDFRVVRTSGVEGEMELDYAALQQLCSPLLEFIERLPGRSATRSASRSGWAAERLRARSSSGLQFSVFSPKPPSGGRSCAWSTTPSGSTARRAQRSRSWLAACLRRGSCSCSRRVRWAAGWPGSRSSSRSVGAAGCAGTFGVRPGGAA